MQNFHLSRKFKEMIASSALFVAVLCVGLLISQGECFSLGRTTRLAPIIKKMDLMSQAPQAPAAVSITEGEKVQPKSGEVNYPEDIGSEWEVDCYSRPVLMEDGKKLWEILITDSTGKFRFLKTLPNNLVNSRNMRKVIEEVMEESPVRPTTIRFFRSQMFNMISIALQPLEVEVKASRRVSNLLMWLQERETFVYPKMPGYNPQLRQQTIMDLDINQPDKLPDVLKAESYAFVALPAEVFYDGQVSKDNCGRGRMIPTDDLPKEGWIHGITLFSKRSEAVAAWMSGLEISHLQANLLSRELMLNTDISTQFVVAPLMDAQTREAQIFEKGKATSNGYHFLSVQAEPDSDEVEGFWLLRQFTDKL